MTKSEFYNFMWSEMVKAGNAVLPSCKAWRKAESDYGKNLITIKAYTEALKDQSAAVKAARKTALDNIEGKFSELLAGMRKDYRLNPNDITEDAQLFTAGIDLTAEEVSEIMDRNPHNATMNRLALDYMRRAGMDEETIIRAEKAHKLDDGQTEIDYISAMIHPIRAALDHLDGIDSRMKYDSNGELYEGLTYPDAILTLIGAGSTTQSRLDPYFVIEPDGHKVRTISEIYNLKAENTAESADNTPETTEND